MEKTQYHCRLCNLKAKTRQNYNQHLATAKHGKISTIVEREIAPLKKEIKELKKENKGLKEERLSKGYPKVIQI